MAPYHILIVIISSVIPENLVLLTKSEQSGPKSAHIRPTIHLFGYFGLVSSLFVSVSACLIHCSTFDGGAIETYGWKTASTGIAEVHSSP